MEPKDFDSVSQQGVKLYNECIIVIIIYNWTMSFLMTDLCHIHFNMPYF